MVFDVQKVESLWTGVLEEMENSGGKVPARAFCNASTELIAIFDAFGKAFGIVKGDMTGNVEKLKKNIEAFSGSNVSLQELVQSDIDKDILKKDDSSYVALLWLKRALQFIQQFLISLAVPNTESSDAASTAYELTLKKYHGFVAKTAFSVAVKAAPYRKDLMKTIAPNAADPEKFITENLVTFNPKLEKVLSTIQKYYDDGCADPEKKKRGFKDQ